MIGDYTWARGPKGDSRSRSAEPPSGSFLTIRRNEMRSTRRCGAEFPRLLQAAEEDDRRRECGPLLVAELVARDLDSFVRARALRVAAILERRRGEPGVSRH